jgi:glucosamine--fructose-6-phosphate aminotransferase (isomerizing)
MEREIAEQPAMWPEVARASAEAAAGIGSNFDLAVIAARGSSDNAALYARYLIEVHLGIPVSLAAPSVITKFHAPLRWKNALVIGVSQSGAAPDVAAVVEYGKQQGATTVALTNHAGSRITEFADRSLVLNVGEERSIAATKTYSATLVAFLELVRAMGGVNLPSVDVAPAGWLEMARSVAENVAGDIVRCQPSFALGRGYGFSTALETSLKLMECALIPCKAFSTADFEHGPKALAGPGSVAVSFDGALPHLAAQGCAVVTAPDPGVPPEIKPIADIVFSQYLALLSARARGLNPDDARYLKKVTETT